MREKARIAVIATAILASALALASLSTGLPWSSAAGRPVDSRCVLSAPSVTISPIGSSGNKTTVSVTVTAHNDGPSPMPQTMLRVSLEDGEGNEVAEITMDTQSTAPVNGSELVTGQVSLDREECELLSTMRISLPQPDAAGHLTELDSKAFDGAAAKTIESARESLARSESENPDGHPAEPAAPVAPPVEPPEPSPQPAYSPDTTDFSSAFVIGDSILAFCRGEGGYGDKLGEALPGIESDVESGRYFEEDVLGDSGDGMIDIARRVAGRYRCYVVECGINDAGLTPAMAQEFIDVLRGDGVRIYLVNQRVVGGADSTTCSTIREMAEANDDVYEIDWNSRATGHESEFFVDICHPNEAGADALVACIQEALTTA